MKRLLSVMTSVITSYESGQSYFDFKGIWKAFLPLINSEETIKVNNKKIIFRNSVEGTKTYNYDFYGDKLRLTDRETEKRSVCSFKIIDENKIEINDITYCSG